MQLYKKIGFVEDEITNRNSVEEKMKEWRNNIMTKSSKTESLGEFQSLREEITKSIKYNEMTLTDEEIESVASHVKSAEMRQKLTRKLQIGTGVQQHCSFADQLKAWRDNAQAGTPCRDTLREALTECSANNNAKEFVYQHVKAGLFGIALNLLMEDVRPMIKALAIDERKISSYIQPVSGKNKGTRGLVLDLLNNRRGPEEMNRYNFCSALSDMGFVDVSRSVFFDYEPNLSEVINICGGEGDMDSFLEHLGIPEHHIAECRDSDGQVDEPKLIRLWKHQIRPLLIIID